MKALSAFWSILFFFLCVLEAHKITYRLLHMRLLSERLRLIFWLKHGVGVASMR